MEVGVEPLAVTTQHNITRTIATTMQTIGNTKLTLHQPRDPLIYLKRYYEEKGWSIEDAKEYQKPNESDPSTKNSPFRE